MAGFPPDYSSSGFFYFAKPFQTSHASQSFQLLYDKDLVWHNGTALTTGGWRPVRPTDVAASDDVISHALLSGVSGQLAANLTDPAWVTGQLTAQPASSTGTNNSIPSGSPAPWTSMTSYNTGQVLAANPSRIMFFVQNIHSGIPLYVNLGNAGANTGRFSLILNPAGAPTSSSSSSWGGSSFADDHYRGPVFVSGGAWMAWEL